MKKIIFSAIMVAVAVLLNAQQKQFGLEPAPARLFQAMPQSVPIRNKGNLPRQIDISAGIVLNQGGIGACGSYSAAAEMTRVEYHRRKGKLDKTNAHNPLFMYNMIHGYAADGSQGTTLYNNFVILQQKGCATFATYPPELNARPTESAMRDASQYKIGGWKTLAPHSGDLQELKLCLARGKGIIASFLVHDSFDQYEGGIYRPSGEKGVLRDGQRQSYHGMLITGYTDDERYFKVLNSWGESWGEKGYLYISYNDMPQILVEAYIYDIRNPAERFALPINVKATKGDRGKIRISWDGEPGAEYEVFRCDTSGGDYRSLGKTSGHFFEDVNVQPGKHYFYQVAQVGEDASIGEFSEPVEGWTAYEGSPPGIPQEPRVSQNENGFELSWRGVDNAASYDAWWFSDDDKEWVFLENTCHTNIPVAMQEKWEKGMVISFIITAKNRFGSSLPSEPVSVVIEDNGRPEHQEDSDETNKDEQGKKFYRGQFYRFPLQRWRAIEGRLYKIFIDESNRAAEKFKSQTRKLKGPEL